VNSGGILYIFNKRHRYFDTLQYNTTVCIVLFNVKLDIYLKYTSPQQMNGHVHEILKIIMKSLVRFTVID
jgi:hypothetical protein